MYSHRGRCNFVSDFASAFHYLSFKWQKVRRWTVTHWLHWWWINLSVLNVSPVNVHIYFFEAVHPFHTFPTGYFQGRHVKYIPLKICIIPSCFPTDWLPSSLSDILFCDLGASRQRLRAKKFVHEREHTWLYALATSLQSCHPDFLESLRDSERSVVLREQLRHFKGRTCHFLLSREASR